MYIRDIMTESVHTIGEDAVAEQAYQRMKELNIHHLVVVRGETVVGVVSERDLGGKQGNAMSANHTVGDFESQDILTVHPDATIQEAASLLKGYNIGCLPVLEEDHLVGIVTISDLLSLVATGVLDSATSA